MIIEGVAGKVSFPITKTFIENNTKMERGDKV